MMFSNKNKRVFISNNNNTQIKPPATNAVYFPFYNNNVVLPVAAEKFTPIIPTSTTTIITENKMSWGEPIWFFFHTMTVKVKEESFLLVKTKLLEFIYSICVNLPCPICSEHAKEYLKNVNFLAIQTKEQLINLLHQFHNTVNARKNYPVFPREEVDAKYSLAITANIFQNFLFVYRDKHNYNAKNITSDFIRSRLIYNLKDWYSQNMHHFNG